MQGSGATEGAAGRPARSVRRGSPARIWFLATATFTQLLRMKTLYFLLIFSLLIVLSSTFNVFSYSAEQQLKLLKDVSLGAMSLFTSLFAIVATAMLIPRDIEDRTLYTILAKPVPRHDYLLGKLLGVLLVVAVTLVVMDVLFSAVLYVRQEIVLSRELSGVESGGAHGVSSEALDEYRRRILAQGLTWSLQTAVVAVFLKAAVITAVTMLISTVASSSLFTIIVAIVVFFIGHIQAVAREYWVRSEDGGFFLEIFAAMLPVLFPDFQLFNVIDGVVAGEWIPLAGMLRLAVLTGGYLLIYTLVAYLIFMEKEL